MHEEDSVKSVLSSEGVLTAVGAVGASPLTTLVGAAGCELLYSQGRARPSLTFFLSAKEVITCGEETLARLPRRLPRRASLTYFLSTEGATTTFFLSAEDATTTFFLSAKEAIAYRKENVSIGFQEV